jgi:hypothetical protein
VERLVLIPLAASYFRLEETQMQIVYMAQPFRYQFHAPFALLDGWRACRSADGAPFARITCLTPVK